MRLLNGLICVLLAGFTAFLGIFSLGIKEQLDQLLAEHFWKTLAERFFIVTWLGLVVAVGWWLLNALLVRIQLVYSVNLRKTALWLGASVAIGALAGTLVFCLA